jgi:hypothetical protein
MDKPDLFRPVARARASDPITSYSAAEAVEASGRAGCQRRQCLDEVKLNPGQTAAEIALAIGLDRYVPSRRLPELRDLGLVQNGLSRPCKVKKSMSLTWWPGPK